MKLKEALKSIYISFCSIATFQLLFISSSVFWSDNEISMDAGGLFSLVVIAFFSSLPILLFVHKETISRVELVLRKVAHFILTAAVVFSLLLYYEWLDTKNALFTVVFFLFLYIALYVYQTLRAKRLAAQINERLNAFHNEENETHSE
ncbi:MAG: DUF3021 domain-containing protein [Defluviitaleaceae bacterium]|nr:DUF3021 domain-containing protein [Defluviitaleaceae bacterium]